jgi:hypothetical protein
MPVDFLTDEQEQAYGRFTDEPPLADLERYFHLDDADRAFIAERRGDHNRLGLGVQLTTVRYLGTFLDDPTAVPAPVVRTVAAQLGIADIACLARYRVSETRWDHTAAIRRRYVYREFADQPGHWRFVRWLYARAWTGAERPTALFDQAVARLIAQKVLLPGGSVLERLVAQVRDRAAARLWRRLARLPDARQCANLERLVLVVGDDWQTPLDRLRRGPTRTSSVALVAALARLDEVRALGVGGIDLAGLPASRVRVLARYASATRAQTIARMAPERRTATLLAFAQILEAEAQDDALDVLDQLLDDLFREAAKAGKQERLRTLRDLDTAALLLRDVCGMLRDPQ